LRCDCGSDISTILNIREPEVRLGPIVCRKGSFEFRMGDVARGKGLGAIA
jgi:hypothetical protein